MKKVFFFLFLIGNVALTHAQLYTISESEVSFFSKAPLENIEAKNKDAKSLLNAANNEIAVIIPIIKFKFEKPLMEEHFNENYMETAKYSTSVFKGKIIERIDYTKDGVYDVTANGKLNMHGVDKDVVLKGKMEIKGEKITLDCSFKVLLKDYNIEIPKLVIENIAEEVDVKTHLVYVPKK